MSVSWEQYNIQWRASGNWKSTCACLKTPISFTGHWIRLLPQMSQCHSPDVSNINDTNMTKTSKQLMTKLPKAFTCHWSLPIRHHFITFWKAFRLQTTSSCCCQEHTRWLSSIHYRLALAVISAHQEAEFWHCFTNIDSIWDFFSAQVYED